MYLNYIATSETKSSVPSKLPCIPNACTRPGKVTKPLIYCTLSLKQHQQVLQGDSIELILFLVYNTVYFLNTLAQIVGWGMSLKLKEHFSHKLEKIFYHSQQKNYQFVAIEKCSPMKCSSMN